MSKCTRLKSSGHTRTRKLVKEALKSIGVIQSECGVQSSRAGGAIAAAKDGVSDHAFKHHNWWKQEMQRMGI